MPKATYDPRGKNGEFLAWAENKIARSYVKAIARIRGMLSVNVVERVLLENYIHGGRASQLTKQDVSEEELAALFAAIASQFGAATDELEEFIQILIINYTQYAQDVGEVQTAARRAAFDFVRGLADKANVDFNITFDDFNQPFAIAQKANQMRLIREHVDANNDVMEQQKILDIISARGAETATGLRTADGSRILDDRGRPMRLGDNPKVVAERFKDSIGLTRNQMRYVERFEQELIDGRWTGARQLARRRQRFELIHGGRKRSISYGEIVREYIDVGVPIPNHIRKAMVDQYRRNLIQYRARVISRTESLRSIHQGAYDSMQAGILNGHIDPNTIVEQWSTSLDERVRGTHVAMEGQYKGTIAEGYYVTGGGSHLRFPCDPAGPPEETIQCRCASLITVDYGAV